MTPEGKLTYLLEPTANPPRGMSIWLDPEGSMYSIDQNNHTKTQTLLLRRTTDGNVLTLAGSAYGHLDGKGEVVLEEWLSDQMAISISQTDPFYVKSRWTEP